VRPRLCAVRTSVLVAAALVCATITGCGAETASTSSSSTTPAGAAPTTAADTSTGGPAAVTSTSADATAAASGNDVLGPSGWGPLTLGQDPTDAAATGLFTDMPAVDDICVVWQAALASPLDTVVISPHEGVVAIIGRADAVLRTPEGMTVGSTAAEVHAMYPEFPVADAQFPNGRVITATGNPDGAYRLQFDDDDVLQTLTLESTRQDCYG
jgi:hypothetical protein